MEEEKRWRVRRAGSDKPTMSFASEKEALAYAQGLASRKNPPTIRIRKRG